MPKYVAFLRAINVGGTSLLKMDMLKKHFESFGLEKVQTYIQTGNVIFETKEMGPPKLEKMIDAELEKTLGYNIGIFLRTMDDVVSIAEKSPFKPGENETVHISFLAEKPGTAACKKLTTFNSAADKFLVKGREAYNLRHDREASVFSNQLIEKVLGVPATTRNQTTIKKIAEKYGYHQS
jgi:uncharacterized protein (DUF1697 family)